MPIRKLSKSVVKKTKPSDEDLALWDEGLPGFGLRVKPCGARSYIIQFRTRATGTSRRMTIGQHGPLLTFDQVKRRAPTMLADIRGGLDPAVEKRSVRDAPTVRELADDYIRRHAVPNKRPKGVRDDRAMLDKVVLPRSGRRKVSAVGGRNIEALHVVHADRPDRANRLLALLSKVFSVAVE